MKKKLRSLFIALAAVFTMSLAAGFSACKKGDSSIDWSTSESSGENTPTAPDETPTEEEKEATAGLLYTLKEDGTYAVSVGTATGEDNIVIPSYYEGKEVTSVQGGAFEDCTSLTSVTIGRKVKRIERGAFKGCTALKSVELPYEGVAMHRDAFTGCTSLEYASYEGGLYLGNKINAYKVLVKPASDEVKTVVMHDYCRAVAENAFFGHENLESLTVGGNVERIADMAFSDCDKLASLTVSSGVKVIGEDAFSGCDALKSVVLPKSVESVEATAFMECKALSSVELLGVKKVGGSAFAFCAALKDFSIADSVEEFASDALTECKALNKTKYNGVGYVGNKNNPYILLYSVEDLEETELIIHEDTKFILESALLGTYAFEKVVIPDKVVSIGVGSFSNCKGLKEVVIGKSVKTIEAYAFTECYNLEKIVFSESVETIGEGAFSASKDNALTTVKLSSGIKTVGDKAFYGCTSLKEIDLNSVEHLGRIVFYGCTALEEVTIPKTVNYIGDNLFIFASSMKKVTFEESSGWTRVMIAEDGSGKVDIPVEKATLEDGENAYRLFVSGYYCLERRG